LDWRFLTAAVPSAIVRLSLRIPNMPDCFRGVSFDCEVAQRVYGVGFVMRPNDLQRPLWGDRAWCASKLV
jgi:hypothetical protein